MSQSKSVLMLLAASAGDITASFLSLFFSSTSMEIRCASIVQAFEVLPEPSGPTMRRLCELPVKRPRPSRGHGLLSVIAKTNGYARGAANVSKSDPPSLRSAPGEGMGRGAGHTARAWEEARARRLGWPRRPRSAPCCVAAVRLVRLCGCPCGYGR